MRPTIGVMLIGVMLILPILLVPQGPVAGEPVPQTTERQLAYLGAQQKVILEQLQMVLDVRKLVIGNTQRLSDMDARLDSLEARTNEHFKAGATDPTTISVLKLKVDAILSGISYLGMGVGTLIVGALGALVKKRMNRDIPPVWAATQATLVSSRLAVHDENLEKFHGKVLNEINEVKEKAEAAYREANTVNEKLASIGIKMADDKPLH
jgi:hypothetical protein